MGSDDHASFSHSSDPGNFGSSASGSTKGAIAGLDRNRETLA
jgi:hypothetical protein